MCWCSSSLLSYLMVLACLSSYPMGIVLVVAYPSSYLMVLACLSSYLMGVVLVLAYPSLYPMVLACLSSYLMGVVLVLAYPSSILDGVGMSVIIPIGIVLVLACSSGPSSCSCWPSSIRRYTYWRPSFILVGVGACCSSVHGRTHQY